MVNDLLKSLLDKPRSLRIHGKSLLYNIDLTTELSSRGQELQFLTQGSIRVGPLKSSGHFKTVYEVRDSQSLIQKIDVDFPKINFKELYVRRNEELLFTNKKLNEAIVDESFGLTYDPQPLLFKMALLEGSEDFQYSDRLLLSGKTRPYQFLSEGKSLSVKLEGKEIFRGTLGNPIAIEIPKFKVKVNLVLN